MYMKKILIIVLVLFVGVSANAQGTFESNVKVRFDAGIDSYKK